MSETGGTIWKDWCPLCGRRFQADTPEELIEQITGHVDDGSCERNFRPLDVALADSSYDAFPEEAKE